MLITFKILEEIQRSTFMMLYGVSSGTFLMRLSLLTVLGASLAWIVKGVMGGWSRGIIHQNIPLKEAFHLKSKTFRSLKTLLTRKFLILVFRMSSSQKEKEIPILKS